MSLHNCYRCDARLYVSNTAKQSSDTCQRCWEEVAAEWADIFAVRFLLLSVLSTRVRELSQFQEFCR